MSLRHGRRQGEQRIADKREAHLERLAYWQGLSVAEKLASLDRRLGPGLGAERQRHKLLGGQA